MTVRTPGQADLAVVGGGIVGLGIAEEAARAGRRVVVLEKQTLSGGAAGVAAGMLAPASEIDVLDDSLLRFALESCAIYPQWVARLERETGIECGYRTEGTLLVAVTDRQVAEVAELARMQDKAGIETRDLDTSAILAMEPNLSPAIRGGRFIPGDLQVDPRKVFKALLRSIANHGGVVREGADVTGFDVEGGRLHGVAYTVGGAEAHLRTNAAVITAGAWSNTLIPGGGSTLPLRPVKGQIVRLRGEPLINHVVRTPDVYLVPRRDGELVVGATMEERGFDTRSTAGGVRMLLDEAFATLPGTADLEITEFCVGLRPATLDQLPVIAELDTRGLYLATGHYRHGVMLTPATAALLGRQMATGEHQSLLEPFGLARFTARV